MKKDRPSGRRRPRHPVIPPATSSANTSKRRTLRLATLGTLVVVAVAASWLAGWWNRRPPQLPIVELTAVSAPVRRTVERHVDDLRRYPESPTAWGQLGSVLYAYRFTPQARRILEEAERRDPRNPRWPYLQALALRVENPAAAEAALRRATDLCGHSPPAPRLRLAQMLAEQGRCSEAASTLEPLLALQPPPPHAQLLAAQLAHQQGNPPGAIELARVASQRPETARPALALLASLLARQGDNNGAVEAAERATTAPGGTAFPDPYEAEALALREDPSTFSERVHPLMAAGRLDEAAAVVARLTQDYPDYPDTWLAAGRLQFLGKNLALADAYFRRHLQLAPRSVQGWFQLGSTLLAQQRDAEAVEAFDHALETKPDFGPAWFNRGLALGRSGRRDEAMAAFREAIRHSPEHIETYLLFADLHLQAREKEPALGLLEQAALLAPGDRRLAGLRRKAEGLR